MSNATLHFPSHMPVEDRAADVWEALVMVADAAGGHWPLRARNAAIAVTTNDEKASPGVQLLSDLRIVFGVKDKLTTEQILQDSRTWQRQSGGTSTTMARPSTPAIYRSV